MKYLILSVLMFCSLAVYGQDLIITSTGDSLKCKIIEVNANEIQFRFGTSGNVISIKKSEAASYTYNFAPTRNVRSKEKKGKTARTTSPEYLLFDAAIAVGTTSFGSVSFGKTKGAAFSLGVDAAYFFKPWLGAGIKMNIMSCDVDFGKSDFYHDRVMFYGPALRGRWGNDKLFVTACASVGGMNWKLSKQKFNNESTSDKAHTSVGGYLSAGLSYFLTQHIGFSLNLQSMFGSVKDKDVIEKKVINIKRNPAGIGCTLGINFRF